MKIIIAIFFFVSCTSLLAKKNIQPKVSKEVAQKTALASVPGGVVKEGELEHESGEWIWSFDIQSGKNIHEVWVDPMKGNIIKTSIETPKDQAKEARLDKAEAAAKQSVPGEVLSSNETISHGQKMYVVRIKNKDGKIQIVQLDGSFNVVPK
ncbi:MAG TPA: PepSY domain-containing protein [Candidatus Kapabacteria bacterium]|nr:PepSY domain-containing protein [Candidatus Kapabacteria bacterium]